ncbi:MAG: alpha/beta fold hydrolase [Acidimicrobiales bacterium]
MAQTITTFVKTPDGRNLCVESGGDPSGRVVLSLHGWPGSRIHPEYVFDAAEQGGIHLLGYDRPGYGGSSPHPTRSVASCAQDVRTIARSLGFDRLGICGASGGGPHALAVGALLPDLAAGVAAVCSLAPRDARGLGYLAGMQAEISQIHRWFDDDFDAVRRWATSYRTEVEEYTPEQIEQLAAEQYPDADVPRSFLRSYTETMQSALAPGIDGLIDDGIALHGDWNFEVGTIGTPVRLWSGAADLHVPLTHSEWLAAQLPGATLESGYKGGHLEIIAIALPDAHRWLSGCA